MPELRLPGGYRTEVVRSGATVRRSWPEQADFVHALLYLLEHAGWPGSPRFLGKDERGREVLSYLDGHVPLDTSQLAEVRSDVSLAAAARLIRQFHDLTAGSSLAGDAEVVCHNDLSPDNTVYRPGPGGLVPVAFIDWDIAAPGDRIHDVAHACWQFAGLGPGHPSAADAGRQVALISQSYGLADTGQLIETILWWQDRCWRGIEDGAAAGNQSLVRLRDLGGAGWVRAEYEWVAANRHTLEAALR
jgi:aminoglycoside phosphotransferase (APT) family kinase protein